MLMEADIFCMIEAVILIMAQLLWLKKQLLQGWSFVGTSWAGFFWCVLVVWKCLWWVRVVDVGDASRFDKIIQHTLPKNCQKCRWKLDQFVNGHYIISHKHHVSMGSVSFKEWGPLVLRSVTFWTSLGCKLFSANMIPPMQLLLHMFSFTATASQSSIIFSVLWHVPPLAWTSALLDVARHVFKNDIPQGMRASERL